MPDTQSGDSATIELPEPQSRERLHSRLQAVETFFRRHPSLPDPSTLSIGDGYTAVSVYVDSRAELDAFAGYFGQAPPADASNYDGAQFYVRAPGVYVTVSYHADRFR